jgi:hypothetical protein
MKRLSDYGHVVCSLVLMVTLLVVTADIGNTAGGPPTQNVNVINTPLPVREVFNPASQPFQASAGDLFGATETSKTFVLATVPAGKRLVIEYATASGFFAAGNKMGALITTTVGGITVQHQLVMIEQGAIADPVDFAAAQPMRLYADPGTNVLGIVFRTDPPSGSGGAGMTISGYYIDIP